eukprot:TRINITY_DN1293_c0_g1_i3.p2 TRINITY_DN1293_c0_g1~~TRINITY_DN1293_c0_g1_i3.p2  ORF type:complete len:221 (+),score=73.69 TRINITY_DN1293_c0_g1_i3:64-726(+)
MADNKEDVVLYSYWRSSCSWRVRIALNLKNIPYRYEAVHLVRGEQLADQYTQLNSMKELPTLVIDGHTLGQSRAIIEYLDETRPEVSLLPQDPYLRAKARQLAEIISSDTQPVQNLRVLNKAGGSDNEKKAEWAKHFITLGLQGFEAEVSKTAGTYCVGDAITVADLCLVPQLYNARRFGVDLSAFPTSLRIEQQLQSHPAFQAAYPTQQPDCPESERNK